MQKVRGSRPARGQGKRKKEKKKCTRSLDKMEEKREKWR